MIKTVKIILSGIGILLILLALYAYRNLRHDYGNVHFMERRGKQLGFTEEQVTTQDGLVLNYGQGPANGPALVLLHGQNASWEDYANVLPELSQHFKIYAVDYYGHGGSSKEPEAYTISKIGQDLLWFIEEVIQEPVVVAGHSSGALITAWLGAQDSDKMRGIVLEDGPFFSTEPGRAEKTFAYLGFVNNHNYLEQEPNQTFMEYSLAHDPMKSIFNQNGGDNWERLVEKPALKQIKANPNKIPKLWYFPPELGVNAIYQLSANMQDGTGDYDLRFGQTFYDFSWFDGLDQEETLKQIQVPTLVMQVAPSKDTAPSYYNQDGILLSAMDEVDAQRVVDLIPQAKYVGGFDSMHDIHADQPQGYIEAVVEFIEELDHN